MAQQIKREYIVSSFKTLCIQPTINYKKIRRAYLKQSKIWHPDRNRDSEAGKQILKINEAYTYLRLFFDQKGQLNDASGIVRSLLQAKEYSIKTNHRTEIKTQLIAFYRGGLAYEKNTSTRTIENIIVYINFFVSLVNLIILPPLLIWKMGWNGLLLALTINVLAILFTMSAFRNLHKIRWFSNFYK
jgi:hypothetical protein